MWRGAVAGGACAAGTAPLDLRPVARRAARALEVLLHGCLGRAREDVQLPPVRLAERALRPVRDPEDADGGAVWAPEDGPGEGLEAVGLDERVLRERRVVLRVLDVEDGVVTAGRLDRLQAGER